jgi:hypothetical protein
MCFLERHQKDMYLKEIGLYQQNSLTTVTSIVNLIVGVLYDHLMREDFHFDNG